MAGAGRSVRRDSSGGWFAGRLWLLDLAGILGAAGFAWLLFRPALPFSLDVQPVRELCLAVAVLAAGVRILDMRARRRAGRAEGRRELVRRISVLDDALMDFRRSLSREAARRFVERRSQFAAALDAGALHLAEHEQGLADEALAFCARLTDGLGETIRGRAAIASLAYRLRQEIARAGRRGEAAPPVVDELCALVEDALAVMDEALYAEWNADHFGRLAAIQRSFGRSIERQDGETVREADRQAAELFDRLLRHLRDKVDIVDALHGWDDVARRFEFALTGPGGTVARHRPPPPRRPLAERFALAPAAGAAPREPAPLRLPAAND